MSDKAIAIARYPIRLGQFLKLADIVQNGLEAKIMIADGEVAVNGEVESRRGRQLHQSDRVEVRGRSYLCT